MPAPNDTEAPAPHPITRPLLHCPRCGSMRLEAVAERGGYGVHFLCRDCDRCWNVSLGTVQRVVPQTCPGCPARDRCERAFAADHPSPASEPA